MLGFAWLTLKQAQEALKNGRLEEAHRLLGQPAAQGHRRSWELSHQVARAFAERGERHLRQDNAEAAWNDVLLAEQMGGAEAAPQLRQELVRRGLDDVRGQLQTGEAARALEAVHRLRERSVQHAELQTLEDAARLWQQAREHAGRGEFRPALDALDRVRRLLPAAASALEHSRRQVDQRQENFAPLLARLHEAANQARWHDVIEMAEQVLAAAPHHPEARKARGLAWKAIEPVTLPHRAVPVREARAQPASSTRPASAATSASAGRRAKTSSRSRFRRKSRWSASVTN